MSARLLLPLAALALAALAAGGLLKVVQTQAEGGVEWIFWVSETSPPLGKPVAFKVWAYDAKRLATFPVTCNMTITAPDGVVFMGRFAGNPAEHSVAFWREGSYNVALFCAANVYGNVTENRFTAAITYRYPQIEVSPANPKWGRPFTLTFRAEHPYNEQARVEVGGRTYYVWMSDGVIRVPNLFIYDTTVARLHFLGRVTEYELVPEQPRLVPWVSQERVKVYGYVRLKAWFEDDEGAIPASIPIYYYVWGECGYQEWRVPAGAEVIYRATRPGWCAFIAYYPARAFTLVDWTYFFVDPPLITESSLEVVNATAWDYTIRARVATDMVVNGMLQLYVGDTLVASDAGAKNLWVAAHSLRDARPGVYTVRMVFSGDFDLYHEEERVLEVPMRPHTIPLEDHYVVPFGVDVADYLMSLAGGGHRIAVSYVNKTHAVAIVYYPGDDVHLPAIKWVSVRIAYPELSIEEDNSLRAIRVAVRN